MGGSRMDRLAMLTLGTTLVCGALGVAGVHTYARGTDRQRALIDRLAEAGSAQPSGRSRRFARVDRRLRTTSLGRRLELRLAATGLDITPGEFFVYTAAAAGGLWLLAASLLASFFGPI